MSNEKRMTGGAYAFGPLMLVAACSIVDSKYYEKLGQPSADAGPGEGSEVGMPPEAGAGGSRANPGLLQRCGSASMPLEQSMTLEVDTRDLNNRVDRLRGLTTCTDSQDPVGNEGFLAVKMRAGDTWHFHVSATHPEDGPRNPSLYMLEGLSDTCDVRSCAIGSDICKTPSEHFTFTAPGDGIFYLGVDDRNEGGGRYSLEAFHNVCGNGVVLHGEACDPQNKASADVCDKQCRIVVNAANPNESIKPHDDTSVANAIEFAENQPRSLTISGTIGGCERDYYTFAATEGERVRISLLDRNMQCRQASRVGVQLQGLRNSRLERLADSELAEGQGCPTLSKEKLSEGRYYIRLQDGMFDDGHNNPVDYALRVEIDTP